MSQRIAEVAIGIGIDDRTAKGKKSVERNVGALPKRVGQINRQVSEESDRSISRLGRSSTRTIGTVERAAARLFGGRSITSGITARLSAIGDVASAAGTGLGEAAGAAGGLEAALGTVGVAAGATVGILAAAGYAAFKLVDGWAKGAAQIGRTADTIGVARKELQEFAAAAERVGVDKGTAAGTLGSLSQTLNDAKFGTNGQAIAVLARLGIKLRTKSDGTVDVAAMLPDIADALARQTAYGRRKAAGILGIPEGALPAFAQGGQQLRSDMTDADTHAAVLTDDEIARAQRIARKEASIGQLKDRAMSAAGSAAAGVSERGFDAVLSGGRSVADVIQGTAKTNSQAAGTTARAADKIDRAAGRMEQAAGRFSAGQIADLARKAVPLVREGMGYGLSEADATAVAANMVLESGGRHDARENGGKGPGRGLLQWTDKARKRLFRQVMGVDVENSSRDQQWRFSLWEMQNSEARNWARAHANGSDAGSVAAGFARYVERPANKDRDAAERRAVAEAIPVHVTVELVGAQPGTKARVTAGNASRPAISHAVAH